MSDEFRIGGLIATLFTCVMGIVLFCIIVFSDPPPKTEKDYSCVITCVDKDIAKLEPCLKVCETR